MVKFEFPLPDKPWSTNEDRNLNPYARSERIAAWKDSAQLAWSSFCNREKRSKLAPRPALIRIVIPFDTRRRRDPHNYCGTVLKAVIDGLVRAGAWPDDTHEYVEHLAPYLVVDKYAPVIVALYERRNAYIPCDHGQMGTCFEGECVGGSLIEF